MILINKKTSEELIVKGVHFKKKVELFIKVYGSNEWLIAKDYIFIQKIK
jgi:hypothetical protein